MEDPKKKCIRIAKNLLYPRDVIQRIEEAQSEEEMDRITTTARREKMRAEDIWGDHEIECKRKKKGKR